ncbi:MAG: radical SAM protein [Candidatus Aenigmarchaeota archaeon]|nr:radical SAM protein [Candidatus Aenigmarchaeota archaeon]
MTQLKQLFVDITNECNYNCIYCGRREQDYGYSKVYNPKLLDADEIKDIISQLEPELITFSGGEPLHDEESTEKLIDVLRYCKEDMDIQSVLFTNGYRLHDNPKLLETLYQYVSGIQIGVHDYENLDSIKNLIKWKTKDDDYGKQSLKIHFIINNETKKNIGKINDIIEDIGIDSILKHNIYFTFFDMIPLGQSKNIEGLALGNKSTIMERIKDSYEEIYSDPEELKHFNVIIRDKNIEGNLGYSFPECTLKNSPIIDAFGNMRFCETVYGSVFGNVRNDNIDEISLKRRHWFDIIYFYESLGYTYTSLINDLALKDGIDLDKYYRRYCAMNISTLFRHFDNPEELILSLEDMLSEKNPLNPVPEKYLNLDLTMIQKRFLQEIVKQGPELIFDSESAIYGISKTLPEKLLDKIRIDSFYKMFNISPLLISEDAIGSVRDILDKEELEKMIEVIDQDKEVALRIIEEVKTRHLA